jgi:DNA-binding transcriptional LysR family regulator
MDLETLRIFREVAAAASISHAAAKLGRAPSNVTTRVQGLEADLGVELFVRTGKRMHLSTVGQQFLGYAQRLLALEDEARQMVTGGRNGGVLRVGCMESTAASRLPAPLAAYCSREASTRLEVSTGTSTSLLDRLRVGDLDCAFAAIPAGLSDPSVLEELGMSAKRVWKEKLVLLLPERETARSASHVQTRCLAAFKTGCTYRALAEELLGVVAGSGWSVQEVGSYHAMLAIVAAGAGVSLLPESVLALSGGPQKLKSISAGNSYTSLVWRSGYETPAFLTLQDCVTEGAAQ